MYLETLQAQNVVDWLELVVPPAPLGLPRSFLHAKYQRIWGACPSMSYRTVLYLVCFRMTYECLFYL